MTGFEPALKRTNMLLVLFQWPWLALALGVIGALALLRRPRPSDPAWLVCWMLPMYMIHQFEEHGVDLLGRRFHFIAELCSTLGHPNVDRCPADPWFILAVNVGAVWIAGLAAIAWRDKNVLVGLCAFGIPLVNAFAHIVPAVKRGTYNSGLVTAVVLFLPISIHALRVAVRANVLPRERAPFIIGTGALLHAILLSALIGYERGVLPRSVMLALEVGNGFLPLAVGTFLRSRADAARS